VRSWDRASFELNTRPSRVRRRVKQRDLLLPADHNPFRLLGACVVCGVCASILYVWMPLLLVTIGLSRPIGPRIWLIVLAAAVLVSLVLYVFALKQMARYREWAAEI
jgi:membrane protein YdbS with pleckstrin-like domain